MRRLGKGTRGMAIVGWTWLAARRSNEPQPGVLYGHLLLGRAGQGGVRLQGSRDRVTVRPAAVRRDTAMKGKRPGECHNIAARGQP
jgi:hypothetical protein